MSRPPLGLPQQLPPGERLLWQGTPDWRSLALRAFHLRGLALYFGVLVVWSVFNAVWAGEAPRAIALSTAQFAGLALVPLLLVALYAWAVTRATTYTITDRRVVIRLGLALPMTINLPFGRIDNAAFNPGQDGSGDIALQLAAGDKLAYLILWPHARPWRMAKPEPMLRAIPDAALVAQLLARALAASAGVPTPSIEQLQAAPQGARLGATRPQATASA